MDRSPYAHHWMLDESVTFLNHGAFGACPRRVLAVQDRFREAMECEPVQFLWRRIETLLDEARDVLARFIGADAEDVALVTNATAGVNAVLRSLEFAPGDELLNTDHEYGACRNVVDFVAARCGARVVTAEVPFPIGSDEQIVESVLHRITGRTRLVMFSHVTSPTGLIWPVERLVGEIQGRGVDVLVDGAHAPGMVPLNVEALGAAYYTGNCHKWMCAPKGAGFLHVRRDRQHLVRPTVISHGASSRRTNRSRFLMEFDWVGTVDPTPWLAIPAAIEFISTLMDGGLAAHRAHNRSLALEARRMLCSTLKISPPAPESMIGSLAAVPLSDDADDADVIHPARKLTSPISRLQDQLWEQYRIDVPVMSWPSAPHRLLRVSAHAYNNVVQYARLCDALRRLSETGRQERA